MTEFPLQKTRRGGCTKTEWGVNVHVAAYRASGAFTLRACFVDYAFVIVVIKESCYYYYYLIALKQTL